MTSSDERLISPVVIVDTDEEKQLREGGEMVIDRGWQREVTANRFLRSRLEITRKDGEFGLVSCNP